MHIDGSCHCGAIKYEADVDPDTASLCHCTDCQTMSGTAFRTSIPAKRETFKVLSGRPKEYVKIAESGNKRIQAFCQDCGTALYAAPADGSGPIVMLRVGAIRQRAQIRPRRQMWARSSVGWLGEIASMERIEKQT